MNQKSHVDGPSLPFPQTPTASAVGRTLAESKHQWQQDPRRLPEGTPKTVIFMSDDAGFSNPDTFGGPVHTPTMTKLAEGGIAAIKSPKLQLESFVSTDMPISTHHKDAAANDERIRITAIEKKGNERDKT